MERDAIQEAPQNTALLRFIFGKNPAWTIARIVIFIVTLLILLKFVVLPIRVTGNSMYPTFHNGQIKFVNRLAYIHHKPERGDIVAVKYAGRGVVLLKRIIGLPGDTIQVREGLMYINGKKLDEPYAFGKISGPDPKTIGESKPHKLEWNEYFVLGDNRPISEWYIKYAHEIVGKVI
ncbi:MAG: signal peptidase I [Verrucomicrobiota bacterium]